MRQSLKTLDRMFLPNNGLFAPYYRASSLFLVPITRAFQARGRIEFGRLG